MSGRLCRSLLHILLLSNATVTYVSLSSDVSDARVDCDYCMELGVDVIWADTKQDGIETLAGARAILLRCSPTAVLSNFNNTNSAFSLTSFLARCRFSIVLYVTSLFLEGWELPPPTDAPLARLFDATANLIRQWTFPYVVISTSPFFQHTLCSSVIHRGCLVSPLWNAHVPWVDVHDVAEGVVVVALDSKPQSYASRHLVFAGEQSMTCREVANCLGCVRTRPVRADYFKPHEFLATLTPKMDKFSAECCAEYYELLECRLSLAHSYADVSHLRHIIGRPLCSITQYIRQNATKYITGCPNYFFGSELERLLRWFAAMEIGMDSTLSFQDVRACLGSMLGAMRAHNHIFQAANITKKERLSLLHFVSIVSVMAKGSTVDRITLGRYSQSY